VGVYSKIPWNLIERCVSSNQMPLYRGEVPRIPMNHEIEGKEGENQFFVDRAA